MTGAAGDIIPIVIVPVVALAFWLVMMYRANSHPQWGSQAPADNVSRTRWRAASRLSA